MGAYFPIFINMEGKQVQVFGGGTIAGRRISVLLEFGARICVTAPEISEDLKELAEREANLTLEYRTFRPGELQEADMVLAATDDKNVNDMIYRECRHKGILVNVASDKEKCDFWGMTGQAAGEYKAPFYSFDEHVHSYFMVFKKNVLKSKAFKSFWEEFTYPTSFREAIVKFELGINVSLKKNGFIGKSFIDIYKIKLKSNENPCYSHVYELVRNYKIPMMKKKCVLIRNIGFVDTLRTIQYLKDENLYPTDWMITCLENQFYIPGIGVKPCNSLELFYKKYSTIYIYGAGVCGKNLAVYFAYKHWSYKGFIVTDVKANHYIDVYCDTNINDLTAINVNDLTTVNINNNVTENIALNNRKRVIPISIQEAEINPDTGIIISVIHSKVAREIENIIAKNLDHRYHRDQLFFLSACSAIKMPDDKEGNY